MNRTSIQRQSTQSQSSEVRQERKDRFVAELVANGGNATAAARAVGYHPDHGRRLVSRDATVRATLDRMQDETQAELREWVDLAPRAQERLAELVESPDEKVALAAAREILDRAIGKAPVKVEKTVEHRTGLTEIELQCVLSLMAAYKLSLLEAQEYVRSNPVEVQEWAAKNCVVRPALPAPTEEPNPID